MTNAEIGQRQANRRSALSAAAGHLREAHVVFPDYRAWEEEVTSLADRLLPWLNTELANERPFVGSKEVAE